MSGFGPGKLFASDYRIESVLSPVQPNRAYIATEVESGRRVRIVELPRSQSLSWARAAIEHPALSELLSVLTVLDSNFGVFAEGDGAPVSSKLALGNPLGAVEAVQAALRVAEALTVLHRAGLTHGSIGPDNVVLDPEGRAVLTFGSVSRQPTGYRAPDRTEADLAPEDDLWATGALLFEMLTGDAPPESGISAPEQLEDAGIEEDVLGGIVAQALAADPNRRSARIASMRHPLHSWLERNEQLPKSVPGSGRSYAWSRAVLPSSRPPPPRMRSDAPQLEVGAGHLSEPPPAGMAQTRLRRSEPPELELGEGHLSEPPPEDDAAPPMSGQRARAGPPTDSEKAEPASNTASQVSLIVGAAVVLAGVVLLVVRPGAHHHAAPANSARPTTTPATTRHAPARNSAKPPAPPAPAEPAVVASAAPTPTASAAPDESVAVCAARHLPAFSFAKMPDMDWLCKEGDPRPGAQRLHGDIVRAANGKTVSPAMQLWSPLTWYGMAEFAVLRGACCPDAPPLKLPAPSAGCHSLAGVLNELAGHVAASENPGPDVEAFSEAVGCELRHHHQLEFWQKGRPDGSEAHFFDKLLEMATHPRSTP